MRRGHEQLVGLCWRAVGASRAAAAEWSGSKSRRAVFGVSVRKCVRRDAEQGRGAAARVAPSSESSLLDALSLQSHHAAGTGTGTGRVVRLSAERLYDQEYCCSALLVPHVVRACCQHLIIHGNCTAYSSHLDFVWGFPSPSFPSPIFSLPSPLEVSPFPSLSPLRSRPPTATRESGGAHELPQHVRAEPSRHTHFGAFRHRFASF